MPRPLSPEEKILKKAKELLEAWPFAAAIDIPLAVRHWRNRHSKMAERPVLSIRFIDVNPNTDMGRYHSTDEECWIMGLELIVDVALPPESSDADETGVGILTVACNQSFKALSNVANGLVAVGMCDDVVDMGCGPDDDSSPDDARLVQSVNVLYRTATGDRSILLAPGENL